MLCSLVKAYQPFGGTHCLHLQGQRSTKAETACLAFSLTQKVMAIHSFKASADFYQVTRCHTPEDCTLQSQLSELQIQQTYVWGHVYCHGISRRLYATKHYTVITLFWHNVNLWLTKFLTEHSFGFSPNPCGPSSNVLLTEINATLCTRIYNMVYDQVTHK
jgi:hypothetical protein